MTRIYRRRGAIGYWVAIGFVMSVLAIVGAAIVNLYGDRDALAGDVRVLREQVESTGQEPAAPDPGDRIDDLRGERGEQGEQGEKGEKGERGKRGPAPTAAQIRSAAQTVLARNPDLTEPQIVTHVTSYLRENPPPPGDEGRPPTAEETFIAVSAYCADDACRGDDGADAPPVTDEQIAAQVAAYCNARGECRGKDGRDGTNGTDGTDGRGIVDVDCNEDADLVITYDQPPLVEVIEGPCRIPEPEPTETPEPTPDPTTSNPPEETS